MTIKIEKGVPIPAERTRGKHGVLYPWAQMVPGDSFAVDIPKGKEPEKARQGLHSTACSWARKNRPGARWRARIEGGARIRIWLVSVPVPKVTVHRLADDDKPVRAVKGSRY